jgi:hypothetical protein
LLFFLIIFFCRVLDTFLLPGARHPLLGKRDKYGKYRGIARSFEPGRGFSLRMKFGSFCEHRPRIGQF